MPAVKQIEEARGAEERLADLLRDPQAVEFLARLLAERERRGGQSLRRADAASSMHEGDGLGRARVGSDGSSLPQRVVSLVEAERLIGNGYEFVARLGADRAILRLPR